MTNVMVIAPHPDDETLGCGGILLKEGAAGRSLHWVIVTDMSDNRSYSDEQRARRDDEIRVVGGRYGFASVVQLGHPTTKLDVVPRADLVGSLRRAIDVVNPDELYVPFRGDVHSDHRVTYEAVMASVKWFRMPRLLRVMMYETLSETEFGSALGMSFQPNVFADISHHVDEKVEIMRTYQDEIGEFPFPRSEEAIRALGRVRGSAAGFKAAEAFQLVLERRL